MWVALRVMRSAVRAVLKHITICDTANAGSIERCPFDVFVVFTVIDVAAAATDTAAAAATAAVAFFSLLW